jgi:hypothetical protein
VRKAIQRLDAHRGQRLAVGLDPTRGVAWQQRPAGDLPCRHSRSHALGPTRLAARIVRALEALRSHLDVDPGVFTNFQLELMPAPQHVLAKSRPKPRQHGPQRRLPRLAVALGPQRLDQLVAVDRTVTVQDQVRERQAPLVPRKCDLAARVLRPHRATELNAHFS